ncbi:hypothetical protein ASPVEDRAFT_32070 [Aspergillus versicolor CBS 583.65]|uniref:Uncharacterized protein n=1 Tax=Aspergillus versicolor CBS 583.65 TaxID=1036611 RepID=A0A1L9PW73_ASPVE|nr:uncharacterized protein ASPVEDRAFT_32070 [Aspergillus versicolor CBS 583.65]OJJ05713.1 hypothetical protein ASPVEDRAFT_32070 [Aspergillus versicolor CBS 583.65]
MGSTSDPEGASLALNPRLAIIDSSLQIVFRIQSYRPTVCGTSRAQSQISRNLPKARGQRSVGLWRIANPDTATSKDAGAGSVSGSPFPGSFPWLIASKPRAAPTADVQNSSALPRVSALAQAAAAQGLHSVFKPSEEIITLAFSRTREKVKECVQSTMGVIPLLGCPPGFGRKELMGATATSALSPLSSIHLIDCSHFIRGLLCDSPPSG